LTFQKLKFAQWGFLYLNFDQYDHFDRGVFALESAEEEIRNFGFPLAFGPMNWKHISLGAPWERVGFDIVNCEYIKQKD
jgi:hypothetical protein